MRVDLALQRLQLHAGGKLLLLLQRGRRHLGGQQPPEALGYRLLRLADVARMPVVELQRAGDAAAHHQRHDDGALDGGSRLEPDVLGRAQDAHLAVGDGRVGGVRADDAAGRVLRLEEARVPQDRLTVGDRHGDARRRGEQQAADALRGLAGHAVLHAVERLACQAQHVVGLARAHRIGVHQQADHRDQRGGEHQAGHHHDADVAAGRRKRPDQDHAGQHHQREHEHFQVEEAGHLRTLFGRPRLGFHALPLRLSRERGKGTVPFPHPARRRTR